MTENCVFNEKVHAFLIGLFYQELKAAEGPAGEECFIKAVQRTAEQRGHRMALRAMRDKRPLDYNTYMAYGEIYATIPGKMEMAGEYPDAETRVYTCAWHDTFKEMGLEACGLVYCREIDKGLSEDLIRTCCLNRKACFTMRHAAGLYSETLRLTTACRSPKKRKRTGITTAVIITKLSGNTYGPFF